jgi:hypothetical protein
VKVYDHLLTKPLTRRSMRAMFGVAVDQPLSDRAMSELYDRWCSHLQQRAAAHRIAWLPASGHAYTYFPVATPKVQEILVRILETTPVVHRPRPKPAKTQS